MNRNSSPIPCLPALLCRSGYAKAMQSGVTPLYSKPRRSLILLGLHFKYVVPPAPCENKIIGRKSFCNDFISIQLASCQRSEWDFSLQNAINSKKYPHNIEINIWLDKVDSEIKSVFRLFNLDNVFLSQIQNHLLSPAQFL